MFVLVFIYIVEFTFNFLYV